MTAESWTVDDAVHLLDPKMTAEQVRALILLAGIEPNGRRHTGRRGRPAETYAAAELLKAHAAVAHLLAERKIS